MSDIQPADSVFYTSVI